MDHGDDQATGEVDLDLAHLVDDERAALVHLAVELGVEQGDAEHEQHDEDDDDAHHDEGGLIDRRQERARGQQGLGRH